MFPVAQLKGRSTVGPRRRTGRSHFGRHIRVALAVLCELSLQARGVDLTFAKVPAEKECECQNRTSRVQIAFRFDDLNLRPGARIVLTGEPMTFRRLMTAFVIAAGVGGSASMVASPAHAQNAVEAEIIGFHQLCEKGDRKACVRFGILIGRNEQRGADWRRAHADWFWFER